MTRPLAASLCGGPCKSSRCSGRSFRVLTFDCDGISDRWLLAAHQKTLSDAALCEFYAEQADFRQTGDLRLTQAAKKLVPEEKV